MKLKTFMCPDCKAIRAEENKEFLGGETGLTESVGDKTYFAIGRALQAVSCLNSSLSGWCKPGDKDDCPILDRREPDDDIMVL